MKILPSQELGQIYGGYYRDPDDVADNMLLYGAIGFLLGLPSGAEEAVTAACIGAFVGFMLTPSYCC